MEAFRRAVKSVGEDRFFQGSVVGEATRYSDILLMFLLRAHRPGRFGSRAVSESADTGMENDDRYLAELRRRMEPLRQRRDAGDDWGVPDDTLAGRGGTARPCLTFMGAAGAIATIRPVACLAFDGWTELWQDAGRCRMGAPVGPDRDGWIDRACRQYRR